MDKTLMKKLKIGVVSLTAVGLLAACGTTNMDEDPVIEDPAVDQPGMEEPAEETP